VLFNDAEAVDLTTKTMLPATARFVAPIVNVERTHDVRDDIQPYECISARDLQQSRSLNLSDSFVG